MNTIKNQLNKEIEFHSTKVSKKLYKELGLNRYQKLNIRKYHLLAEVEKQVRLQYASEYSKTAPKLPDIQFGYSLKKANYDLINVNLPAKIFSRCYIKVYNTNTPWYEKFFHFL